MLWTGTSAAVSVPFKDLLLELAQERSLDELLPLITRRLVEHEDMALARLWLLDAGDQCGQCPNAGTCADRQSCLHLVASAGRPLGGQPVVHDVSGSAFRRIPVGAFKVGQVASSQRPVVLLDPASDPKIRYPAWIAEQRVQGFVGHPLLCRGQLLGVLGVFLRTPVSPGAVDVLSFLANHAAAAIASARAFAEVEAMRRHLQLENQALRQTVEGDGLPSLVGSSPAFAQVQRDIEAVARTDATVLVQGESGTGKELVARAIHRRSHRQAGPFVEVNCAAIPRELCESELFGHVRGAFSGAVKDRAGRFEAASGGTLFLDEVGEMPLELQGKLLRVLQEGTYTRVGEERTRQADVRVVAATNRPLTQEVASGHFRADLYYRLDVYPIAVPPLRARVEDLPMLAAHLLGEICLRLHRPPMALTPQQIQQLSGYAWPGNVRELRNVLERAVISSPGDALALVMPGRTPELRRGPLMPSLSRPVPALEGPAPVAQVLAAEPAAEAGPVPILSDAQMRRRERENLLAALQLCGGRIYGRNGAAALLGLPPTTLASRLARLHLRPRQAS